MNVALAIAGERLSQDDITEPLSDDRIAEIRAAREESHKRIEDALADADPDA